MNQSELLLAFDEALNVGDGSRAVSIFDDGLDPDYRDHGTSFTPLALAAGAGDLSVLDAAIRHGASVNRQSGSTRSTALHLASLWGWADVVDRLVAAGANVNARDEVRSTPLHNAAASGFPLVAKLLLEKGADAKAGNNYGATPLQVAAGASWQAQNMDRMYYQERQGMHSRKPPERDHLALASLLIGRGVSRRDLGKARFFANQYSDPEMQHLLNSANSEGCFIATAVYGSYDAPEVLVLRRFRDSTLANSRLGRAVIRGYYRMSPPLARHIQSSGALSRLCRHGLDALVRKLDR